MTLLLELKPGLEEQINQLADAQGVPMSECVNSLLEKILLRERNEATISALDSFMEGDGEEQNDTWGALEKGLSESRQLTRSRTS